MGPSSQHQNKNVSSNHDNCSKYTSFFTAHLSPRYSIPIGWNTKQEKSCLEWWQCGLGNCERVCRIVSLDGDGQALKSQRGFLGGGSIVAFDKSKVNLFIYTLWYQKVRDSLVSVPALLTDTVIKTRRCRTLRVGPRTRECRAAARSAGASEWDANADEWWWVWVDEDRVIVDESLSDAAVRPATSVVIQAQLNRRHCYVQACRLLDLYYHQITTCTLLVLLLEIGGKKFPTWKFHKFRANFQYSKKPFLKFSLIFF